MSPFLLAVLLALPWVLVAAWVALRPRWPRPLPGAADLPDRSPAPAGPGAPLVSVVVPARNEAHNIRRCLESLVGQDHSSFEVIAVDDRSSDDTAARAAEVGRGRSRGIRVLEGRPLPEGWYGKPWACLQGAEEAGGDLLLFTDADTTHGPHLLRRAAAGLDEDAADALTLIGRQEMRTFWERAVLPHLFLMIGLRYPDLGDPLPSERWEDALANGQYILVRRETYEAIGGHRSVAGEVVEDLALARTIVRSGGRLTVRRAEDELTTRMYRSLREVVDGFTKNVAAAARMVAPGGRASLFLAGGVLFQALFWILPPVVLLAAGAAWGLGALLTGGAGAGVLVWAGITTGVGLLLWTAAHLRFGVPLILVPAYPLGAAVTVWIVLRSWARGDRIEWKGRAYGDGYRGGYGDGYRDGGGGPG